MSNSDAASSTLLSHNTYVVSSSSDEDLIVPNLGAYNAAEGDQEVNQPVGNGAQNENPHQGPNQPAAAVNEQNVIPSDPRRYIGLIICKECNGTKYMGKVVGYNYQRKWFRVEYGEEESEDMDEESVQRLRAKQSDILAAQAQAKAQASGSASTRMKHVGGSRKRSGKEEGYIPLAFRETKKDAYYYY